MRPIDGDTLKERFEMLAYDDWNQGTGTTWARAFEESADVVECAPTIDAVEVVRCRDCRWWERDYQPRYHPDEHPCNMVGMGTPPEWFCADGKRRDDDTD
jgi:hypothetical protein